MSHINDLALMLGISMSLTKSSNNKIEARNFILKKKSDNTEHILNITV